MSSKKQREQQAIAKGYRNLGHRGYHMTDADRGKAAHARRAIPKPTDDPPCIVQCAYCMESVVAARRAYWDVFEPVTRDCGNGNSVTVYPLDELHRHQPEKQRYKSDDGQAVGV